MPPPPPPNDPAASTVAGRGRPPGIIWVTCALLLLFAALAGFGVALLYTLIQDAQEHGQDVVALDWVALLVSAATAVAYLVVAVFLLRGANWARLTGAGLAVLNIATALIVPLATGSTPNCLSLLPQIAILALLFRREVAEWCYPA